jgi:hypothetical protein
MLASFPQLSSRERIEARNLFIDALNDVDRPLLIESTKWGHVNSREEERRNEDSGELSTFGLGTAKQNKRKSEDPPFIAAKVARKESRNSFVELASASGTIASTEPATRESFTRAKHKNLPTNTNITPQLAGSSASAAAQSDSLVSVRRQVNLADTNHQTTMPSACSGISREKNDRSLCTSPNIRPSDGLSPQGSSVVPVSTESSAKRASAPPKPPIKPLAMVGLKDSKRPAKALSDLDLHDSTLLPSHKRDIIAGATAPSESTPTPTPPESATSTNITQHSQALGVNPHTPAVVLGSYSKPFDLTLEAGSDDEKKPNISVGIMPDSRNANLSVIAGLPDYLERYTKWFKLGELEKAEDLRTELQIHQAADYVETLRSVSK